MINKEWHLKHRMPKNANFDERVKWHLEHKKNCSCRPISGKLLEEMKRKKLSLKLLEKALKKSWRKDTCYRPMRKKYAKSNPAYGQCYCTALVVNDYFGGKILTVEFPEGGEHYWNLIRGKEIDITRCQFDKSQKFPKPTIIGRKDTKNTKEYLILKKRVQRFLKTANH